MAELKIVIEDTDENTDGEIEVKCIGDTEIYQKATPAQILAHKCMEFIAKELEV